MIDFQTDNFDLTYFYMFLPHFKSVHEVVFYDHQDPPYPILFNFLIWNVFPFKCKFLALESCSRTKSGK